jgi:hypothetical protein
MNRNTFSCRLAGVMLCFLATGPASAGCTLASAAHRVTVLELYTSEGCNTCPPADRWLSGLSTQASTMSKVIPLAFHVDYWNQLGWFDRFSQPRFSERQRQIAERNRMHVIYTPQFVLDGRDWRRDNRTDALDAALTSINAQPARATIQAEVSSGSGGLRVRGDIHVPAAADRFATQAWIALFQNGLSTQVQAGENGGKTLYHDFVVRALTGPLRPSANGSISLDHTLPLQAAWNTRQLGLAIFLQRSDTGDVLQAAALSRLCP